MGERLQAQFSKFLLWRVRNVPQRTFILILSVIVGLISGMGAVILKNSTHWVQAFVNSGQMADYHNLYYFLFPIIGIAITVIIVKIIAKPVGEGIPSTLWAISNRNGILRSYKMYASLITSMFTVGFGGSVGLEGPTVSTGSAIGSNLGRLMQLNYKSRTLLIGCATAAAISSIFNAPIAGIIFTIEIFSLDLTLASLMPLLLASVSGGVTSILINGQSRLFHFNITESYVVGELPYYVLLGVMAALASVYFTKFFLGVNDYFEKIKSAWVKILVAGGALGTLIFLIPPLYGEGFVTINHVLNGEFSEITKNGILSELATSEMMIFGLLAGLVVFKVMASTLTVAAGGVGGVFAPSLFIGSVLGALIALGLNAYFGTNLRPEHFALSGMAGLMAGVLHAPLTAIFMIAEISGGYELFIPLMITATASFLVTKAIKPHSIYTHQIAQKGKLLTHDKDQAILLLMELDEVIEKDFVKVQSSLPLKKLVHAFTESKRNIFPVLNEDGHLVGVLTLDDFKQYLFNKDLHNTLFVSDLMTTPPAIIQVKEPMNDVIHKFQKSGAWNLPVVDGNRYIGFISKSKLFSAYRQMLKEVSG